MSFESNLPPFTPEQPGGSFTLVEGTAARQQDDPPPSEEGGEQQHQEPKPFDYAGVFGLPADTKTPEGYKVDHGGVRIKKLVDKDEAWVRFTYAPLVVTATFEDPEGDQFIELSWIDRTLAHPRKISRIVSRETAKRGKKLIEQVGAAGLPAVEGDARALERWLALFEAENRGRIPSEKLARWLGWQDDGSFVTSPHDGTKVDVVYDEMRHPARAHGRKGTLEDWKATVAALEQYPVPRVVLAASFASALLRALGINSFTVDVSSRSTKGKTTTLQVAASVWMDPSEHANGLSNWRSTLYSIEKRLNLVRGMPCVFDETMAVADDKLIDEVLYQVPLNHGKARSGGAFGSMLPWETILLSSGERPALSFTTAQGAAARILCTTAPPFGHDGGETAVNSREGVLANHGHAGPEFVSYLVERLAEPGGQESLRARHRELAEQLKGENAMTARRAPMVAALALAESIACHLGLLPYQKMPVEQWHKMFSTYSQTDNRPEMAMDVLREYVAGHAWELYPGVANDGRPSYSGWLGAKYKDDDSTAYVALMPHRVRKILEDGGYQFDAVVDAWADAGYLKLSKTQRPAHLIPKRFGGARAKCLHLTEAAISFDASEEAA